MTYIKQHFLVVATAVLCALLFSQVSYSGENTSISQEELLTRIQQNDANLAIIDIRTVREFNNGHVPGAINLPHRDILKNSALLEEYLDKDIVLYCHSGVRVGKVLRGVSGLGSLKSKALIHLKGDYRAWHARQLPISYP